MGRPSLRWNSWIILNNTLENFLRNPVNSLFREAMFRHDLLHAIYHECAKLHRNVHIYEPEIDVSGFDIVLDDLSNTLRFQLKSKMANVRTRKWKIHKTLLRPNSKCLNSLPFCPDSGGVGYMGGVILIRASVTNENLSYSYLYTDALVICALNKGIFAPTSQASKTAIYNTFKELTKPDYACVPIELPEASFWKFTSLKHLLQFAGLNIDSSNPVRDTLHRCVSSLYKMIPMYNQKRLADDVSLSLSVEALSNFVRANHPNDHR
jgi:hypothetical protein